jgi:hypothetical protein
MKQQKFANLPKGQIPFIHWVTNPVPHMDYFGKLWAKCVYRCHFVTACFFCSIKIIVGSLNKIICSVH